jgi:hypothetical protein
MRRVETAAHGRYGVGEKLVADLMEELMGDVDHAPVGYAVVAAFALMEEVNIFVLQQSYTIVRHLQQTQDHDKQEHSVEVLCYLFTPNESSDLVVTDAANTIAIFSFYRITREEQLEASAIPTEARQVSKQSRFNTVQQGHYEALVDDKESLWSAHEHIVVACLYRAACETARRNKYSGRVTAMEEAYNSRRAEENEELVEGQLAHMQISPQLRDQVRVHPALDLPFNELPVRIVSMRLDVVMDSKKKEKARPLRQRGDGQWVMYTCESEWGVLQGEYAIHYLRSCKSALYPSLAKKPLPLDLSASNRVTLHYAWTKHIGREEVPRQPRRPPAHRARRGTAATDPELRSTGLPPTPCTVCAIADGEMTVCGGCHALLHRSPCGNALQKNTRLTIDGMAFHSKQCYELLRQRDATESSNVARSTRAATRDLLSSATRAATGDASSQPKPSHRVRPAPPPAAAKRAKTSQA